MEPLISVIIPIYNMEAYLLRCLDSILNNSYRNIEIICVDDGSQDSTPEILRAYADKDSRIVVICKDNGGVSSARNAGLDSATGDYVTFVDPDDIVHSQLFEILMSAIQAKENSIALCGFRTVDDKDLPLHDSLFTFEYEKLITVNRTEFFQNHAYRSFCWGRLIPTTMLKGLRFREELHYSEDSVFIAEFGEQNPDMICTVFDAPLYYYYQREDSLTKQVKVLKRYVVAEIFTEKTIAAEANDIIYLDQAIKRGLSTRYYAVHIHPEKEIARKCTNLLNSCIPVLKRTAIYSRKRKTLYSIFIRFAGIYWLYRSITEPYMWAWEKVERKKRREERRKKRL